MDKELLKLAAKAAGIEHPDGEHSKSDDGRLWDCKELRWWNPLTDDGDALRLAVKLGANVYSGYGTAVAEIPNDAEHDHISASEHYNNDPYAATRRAIVRAAAEIGKTL